MSYVQLNRRSNEWCGVRWPRVVRAQAQVQVTRIINQEDNSSLNSQLKLSHTCHTLTHSYRYSYSSQSVRARTLALSRLTARVQRQPDPDRRRQTHTQCCSGTWDVRRGSWDGGRGVTHPAASTQVAATTCSTSTHTQTGHTAHRTHRSSIGTKTGKNTGWARMGRERARLF